MKRDLNFEDRFTPAHYNRRAYNEATFLAEYYRWSASKGFPLPGNEPISGKRRDGRIIGRTPTLKAEAILVHKTQARFWANEARKLRQWGIV